MADPITQVTLRIKRGTSAEWAASPYVLASGEPGYDTTVRRMKVGDGVNQWALLKWQDVDAETLGRVEAAADAVESATGANDAVMTTVANDPTSAYYQALTVRDRDAERIATGAAAAKYGVRPGAGNQTAALQGLIDTNTRRRLRLGDVGQILAHGLTVTKPIKLVGEASDSGRFTGGDGSYYGQSIGTPAGSTGPKLTIDSRNVTVDSMHFDGAGVAGAAGIRVANGFEYRSKRTRFINFKGVAVDLSLMANAVIEDMFVDNCGAPGVPGVNIDSRSGRTNNLRFVRPTVERCAGPFWNIGVVPSTVPITTPEEIADASTKYFAEWIEWDFSHMEAALDSGGQANTEPIWNFGNFRHADIYGGMHYGGPAEIIRVEQTLPSQAYGSGNLVIHGGKYLGSDVGAGAPPTPYLINLVKGNNVTITSGAHFDRYTTAAIRIGPDFGRDVYIDPTVTATGVLVEDLRPNTVAARAPYHGVFRSRITSRGVRPGIANPTGVTGAAFRGQCDENHGTVAFGTGAAGVAAGGMIVELTVPTYSGAQRPKVQVTPRNSATAALGPIFVASADSGTASYVRFYTPTAIPGSSAAGAYEFDYHLDW